MENLMPWYSTGTVSVTNNSATVTGTGTAFSANARTGDAIRLVDGRWYEITNIASATVLSIKPNYQGATASGQTYAIAPMQGYVKESADRLRQLVDQFGSQLAALQPWATSATPAAAREALGTNDAANLTAGLLNVERIPATLTPDKAFRRGNILGTVSQSGGVPTGAIIERGSNANGEYIRWADGTQICSRFVTYAAWPFSGTEGAVYSRSPEGAIPYPAPFIAPPFVASSCVGSGSGVWSPLSGATTTTEWPVQRLYAASPAEQALMISTIAVGRWF
jgi:hypothetical protein